MIELISFFFLVSDTLSVIMYVANDGVHDEQGTP
jgi:hypothetical protein